MSAFKDVIDNQLRTGQFLIEKLTPDLSDAEYFKPPVPGGNHAAWILGHIATSEDSILSQATGAAMKLPQELHERFKGGAACDPSPDKYPSRKEIDELFRNARAHTMEALQTFDESRIGDQAPEQLRQFFPTMAAVWGLIGTHQFWHIGQLTNCRKKLGKPYALQ